MTTTTEIDQDSNLEKGTQAGEQTKPDEIRPKTVTPDNDNGIAGEPEEKKSTEDGSKGSTLEGDASGDEDDSSNKGQGPAVENL